MSALISAPGPSLIHRTFQDVDEMSEATGFPGLFTPLTLEPFSCEVMHLDFRDIAFTFFKNATPMRVLGPRHPNRLTFGCLLRDVDAQKVVSHYRPVEPETLYGFDCDREANMAMLAPIFYGHALIKPEVFQRYLALSQRDDIDQTVLAKNYTCIPATIGPLKTYLQELYSLAINRAAHLAQPSFQQLITEDFIPLLIQAMPPQGKSQTAPLRPYRRADLVQQVETFLIENLRQPITLKSLVEQVFTSQRTLFYAFEQALGTTPMVYLKILRLQAVRRVLKAADAGTASISRITAEHGFYSHGHFSRDYKALFGETPSQTLRPRGRVP